MVVKKKTGRATKSTGGHLKHSPSMRGGPKKKVRFSLFDDGSQEAFKTSSGRSKRMKNPQNTPKKKKSKKKK